MTRRLSCCALVVLAVLAAAPADALAHARLIGTFPARGETLAEQPARVVFRFHEPVEVAFGAVRVFDARGKRVDDDDVVRPRGDRTVGVGLRSGLSDGSYTATFRVVSADGHPVSGGLVFSVGEPGTAPAQSVDELIGAGSAGRAASVGLAAAKAVSYAATALLAGGLLFVLVCFPGPGAAAAARVRRLMIGAAIAGVAAGAAGVVLQAAIAGGTGIADALDAVPEVLRTRVGLVWAVRAGIFALLGAVIALAGRRLALAIPFAACLVVAPALAGHPAVTSPRGLLMATDMAHVAAMSAWLGGLALLLAAVPVATRALAPEARAGALAPIVGRFSPIALGAVAVLAATGVVQSIVHLRSFGDLLHTAFGRAVLVKAVLLLALAALGAVNRQRTLPRLRASAQAGAPPGGAGLLLRRVLRAEVALVLATLAVTGALTGYSPPASLAPGPFSERRALGPLTLELTVDPARAGRNEMHLYLLDRSGAPFRGTKEITASLVRDEIGPLGVMLHPAGPGHYVSHALSIAPAGEWKLAIADRVSDFDEYRTTVDVPIR